VSGPSATPPGRVPSAPIPESAERLDEATLERVVRSFYGAAREDALLGPLFAHVTDWEAHIANICAFWSSVALMSGRYHGQPMAAHLPLSPAPVHFARWLELFEQTARSICSPAGADYLMTKARRIASSLELGIAVQRGVLPRRNPAG
jgi:hemoglobin